MKITFVTDYVCPYCIVAKEAFTRAINELQADVEWETVPFELTQTFKPQVDTYNDPVRRSHYTVLNEPCAKMGLDFHIPPAVVPRPYTHMAFEGYHYAKEQGLEEAYSNAVYYAYFRDQKDIGSMEVLLEAAASVGLNTEEFSACLADHRYSDAVDEENRYDREELHVSHVPTIYLDGEEISLSAFTVEECKEILLKKASETEGTAGCGEDGCGEFGCGPEGCGDSGCGPDGCNA